MLLLEVGRDRLHDLLSLTLVVDGVCVEVPGRAELQLGDTSLPVLLDCDLIGLGEALLFPPHHLDEFFQIFDFLGLEQERKNDTQTTLLDDSVSHRRLLTIAFLVLPLINII